MAGAYVAKPAVDLPPPEGPPTVDSVPEGWDLDWPFDGGESGLPGSGPHPPGYEPDYSFAMFGTESIAYDGTASVTGTFRDHSTFATGEPTPTIWTATVSSSPSRSINLRFSGDTEYASSISSDSAFVTYWGVTPDIEFELEEEDDGGTVVLLGMSAIGGVVVGASIEIAVEAARYSVTVTAILSAGYSWNWGGHVRVEAQFDRDSDDTSTWGYILYQDAFDDMEQSSDDLDEVSVATNMTGQDVGGDSIIITSVELNENEIYDLYGYIDGYRCDVSGTVRILIMEEVSETVVYDHTSNLHAVDLTGSPSDWHWINFDTSDGTVAVIAD